MIEVDTAVGTGMKATCTRDELLRHLGVVSRAVSTRMTVQILSGVKLTAAEGRLELAATDMELSLRSSFEAEIGDEGVVVVPGKTFVDEGQLEFSWDFGDGTTGSGRVVDHPYQSSGRFDSLLTVRNRATGRSAIPTVAA